MRRYGLSLLAPLLLSLVACGPGPEPETEEIEIYEPKELNAPFYVIKEYSPERDPAADLAFTAEHAQAEDKRILLIVGGEWCIWCHYLADFLEEDLEVQKAFDETFVVTKINWSEDNKNEAFLNQFPPAEGYPFFIITDSSGNYIGTQGTAELEEGKSYDSAKMIAFAEKWRKS
ncbi:MAG: thiol-disulfide isomerase [Ponticaulis sp.]|nr:thiol-disulfide isomerase [Ponticaulis sp.]|tara:strand:- start:5840 stop:6361 length:522 start_codon:yes stop_codon:yes gene_type:complete